MTAGKDKGDRLAVRVPDSMRPAFEQAQQYVERYFRDRVEDPVRGIIELAGDRYILVRAASMSTEFYDMVMGLYRERGEEEARNVASSFLFDLAHAIGKADARTFHSKMGVTDPIEKLSAGPIHFAFSGWALVDILPESKPSPDEDYFLVYNHPYSFEADSWIRSGKKVDFPVCIMNAGYSSGWCEESFGIPLVAAEYQCRAAGDPECSFVMAPPWKILDRLAAHAPDAARPRRKGTVEVPEFFKRKRLEEEIRQHQEHLEEMVDARTRELTRTNERLRREIEERKRVEGQLAHAMKMEALGALAGGLAHDFNNLLTTVLAGVQLAIRHHEGSEESIDWLLHAQSATEKAADLTKQMLALGRKQAPQMGQVDICEVVTATARFLESTIPETVKITAHVAQESMVICADVAQIEHALINLAINGRDAMSGGGALTFRAEVVELGIDVVGVDPAARPGKFVRLSVTDTGIGVDPELQERIFEPFFTTKGPGAGTGLGLATVYSCAQAHDGWVDVESEVGRGSTFHLFLPWVPAPEVTRADADAEMAPGTETVLLVDDTEAVLYSGQTILESCGYTVLVARDGLDALDRFRETGETIALIVTDLVMPNAGGRDLLIALRDRGEQIPVVLTSGHAINRAERELLSEGFAAFVPKPFDAVTLSAVVRQVLDSVSNQKE